MARLTQLTEFRAKILLAFAGAYLVSWLLILLAIYIAFDDQKEAERQQLHVEFTERFDDLTKQRTNIFALLIDVLAKRQELNGRYSQDERVYLRSTFEKDFSQLQNKLNITHFYITDAERKHIVRLHAPNKYGDIAERYAALVTDNIRETTSSINLGTMGSMTHRVVKPIYSHGELEGFIELGEEIDGLWGEIAVQYDASVFIMVEKSRLVKENWLLGKATFGWPGNWGDLSSHVISGGSNYRGMFDGKLPALFEQSVEHAHGETKFQGDTFVYDNLPLHDTNLGQIGSVFILYPQGIVTGEFWDNLKKASIASAIAMFFGAALCYTFLRPAAKAMEHKQTELEAKIKVRTKDLIAAKELAETETNNAILASKAKSDFLSNMSHELRTPLNSIIGFSSIVMNDEFEEGISDRYKSYLSDINKAGSHLLTIINDILDVSRIEAGEIDLKIHRVNATKLMEECQRMINVRASEKNVPVLHDGYEEDLYLYADATRLKQILLNLLSNAVKFTNPPGTVRFYAKKINETEIEFVVEDEGEGVAKADIPQILRRFGQGTTNVLRKQHEEGTGLGLTLVQDLIKLHNGSFHFSSKEGVGSVAHFILPLKHAHSETSDMI